MEQMYRDHRIVTERDGEKWVVRIRRLDGQPITVHGISHPELSTAECPDAISAIAEFGDGIHIHPPFGAARGAQGRTERMVASCCKQRTINRCMPPLPTGNTNIFWLRRSCCEAFPRSAMFS